MTSINEKQIEADQYFAVSFYNSGKMQGILIGFHSKDHANIWFNNPDNQDYIQMNSIEIIDICDLNRLENDLHTSK